MDVRAAASGVWKAFASRDRETICSVLCEDVEWIAPPHNATAVALGVTSHMVGPGAIADFLLRDLGRLFQDIHIEPLSVTAEGERVVFEQRQTAQLANGRRYENVYVFIFEMEGNRVRRIREYMDTHAGYAMIFGEDALHAGARAPRQS